MLDNGLNSMVPQKKNPFQRHLSRPVLRAFDSFSIPRKRGESYRTDIGKEDASSPKEMSHVRSERRG